MASQNSVDGSAVTLNSSTDVTFGIWDPRVRSFTQVSGSSLSTANAVQIVTSRSAAKGNAILLTFARLLGQASSDVHAQTTVCQTGAGGNYAIVGLNGVTMSANAYTDSYDASQGAYVAAWANHAGSIASDGNIVLSNAAKVDGDARCGIGMTTTLQNTAMVTGMSAPLGVSLGYPSVTLPSSYSDLGDESMSSGTVSVAGGTYLIHNLNLSGSAHIIWTSPVVLYIQNSYSVSGNVIIDTAQNLPCNRVLNFLPTCTSATWSGTNTNTGDMYAPNTDFTISGSVHNYGRIVAKTINNSSSGGMHYDESLAAPGSTTKRESIQTVK